MGNVLVRIKSLSESFSPTEKRLADFVLNNANEVPFLSVHELAGAAGVSVASISRFARTVGYESFKDFKTQLGRDSLTTIDSIYQVITPKDSDEDIIEKVFLGNIKSLEETLGILDRGELIRAAKRVSESKRLVFFGVGSSGYIAQDAALRFSQLDIQAEACSASYQMVSQALRMRKGHIAVGISHSGRSGMPVKALELAGKAGALTIGISNYLRSPLNDVSDIFLCTSFPESRVEVAALSSIIPQVCLVDALYLLVARHNKVVLSKIERLNTYTEEILRLPAK